VYNSDRKGKPAIQCYLIFHTGHGRFTIHGKLLFLKMYSIESEIYMNLTSIFLALREIVWKVCKNLDLSPK